MPSTTSTPTPTHTTPFSRTHISPMPTSMRQSFESSLLLSEERGAGVESLGPKISLSTRSSSRDADRANGGQERESAQVAPSLSYPFTPPRTTSPSSGAGIHFHPKGNTVVLFFYLLIGHFVGKKEKVRACETERFLLKSAFSTQVGVGIRFASKASRGLLVSGLSHTLSHLQAFACADSCS